MEFSDELSTLKSNIEQYVEMLDPQQRTLTEAAQDLEEMCNISAVSSEEQRVMADLQQTAISQIICKYGTPHSLIHQVCKSRH